MSKNTVIIYVISNSVDYFYRSLQFLCAFGLLEYLWLLLLQLCGSYSHLHAYSSETEDVQNDEFELNDDPRYIS
jgi:hypothetical protein